jgi:uncharacterized protein
MTVCIDTNVLLQALAAGNPCAPILSAWLDGRLIWAVSPGIWLEYEEVICARCGRARWGKMERALEGMRMLRPESLLEVSPAYEFHITPADRDDAKFANCAIAAHADFVITEDRHFRPLAGAGYRPQPITPSEFIRRFL